MVRAIRVGLSSVALATTLALWFDGIAVVGKRVEAASLLSPLLLLAASAAVLWVLTRFPGWERIALAYVSAGLSLVAFDVGLRFALPGWFYYREHERFVRPLPGYRGLTHYLPNVSVDGPISGDLAAMLGAPELAVSRRSVFRTDELGFRNEPGRSTGPIDLLIVGDSFAVGSGTSQPSIWVEQLGTDSGIHLYNLSMPGGAWHHLLETRIFLASAPLRPGATLLLCIYAGNDLDDYYGPQRDPEELRFPDSWEALAYRIGFEQRRNLVRKALERLGARPVDSSVLVARVGGREGVLFYRPHWEAAMRSEEEVAAHANAGALRAVLDSFRELATAYPFQLRIVLFPSKEEVYAWALSRQLANAVAAGTGFARLLSAYCAAREIPFLDLTPGLVEEAKRRFARDGELLWWPDDSHPNEEGHRVAATLIGGFLGLSPRRRSAKRGPARLRRRSAGGVGGVAQLVRAAAS